jgi:hypothetical protein
VEVISSWLSRIGLDPGVPRTRMEGCENSAKHGKVEAFGRDRSGFGMEGSAKHGKSRAREIGMRSVARCIRRIIR